MRHILETIKLHKLQEVEQRKQNTSEEQLKNGVLFKRSTISLVDKIRQANTPHIIAEFKRQSPSKGIIRNNADIVSITAGYQAQGASAVSVLNDTKFFGAKANDFITAREQLSIPLLQKDFIVDKYQITEAKAMGADLILLIAKMLPTDVLKRLAAYAHQIGLEVLLETHNEKEIKDHLTTEFDLIGINNRDLNTFRVDIANSIALSQLLPKSAIKVAESGLDDPQVVTKLYQEGFNAFLIGEYFMKASDPTLKLKETRQKIVI
ncbi:indole-3-glycerol phosphate synthase TrpC [Myroides pelagicus]|uniref:indole-3-glycerol-phosphate synthase n=1 Tax=Myroides pelagicus TaxID=270914 RepID=A0A7K1GKT3_9FLAO|nr:indole-3-glycerol phosphate synthase TrpC [Myroides pelagicus]MEC4112954.1 indole-3-glycerol phosphate synthase TrpC [Myroides pelagicus]MTH29043.1 indole-3-glycerol phosphate synthase TrpC [Myroides pelagicus]